MDDERTALLEFAMRLSAYSENEVIAFDLVKLREIRSLALDDAEHPQDLQRDAQIAPSSV